MEDKGMNRGEYLAALIAIEVAVFGLAFAVGYIGIIDVDAAVAILSLVSVVFTLWVTALRCADIGIGSAWAFCLLIPFGIFYFLFKRGKQYYDEHAPVLSLMESEDDPIS